MNAPSTIRMLHGRYEAVWRGYEELERAEVKLGKQPPAEVEDALAHCAAAKLSNIKESDALRSAILYQVPDDWTEAMILQFHIINSIDLVVNSDARPDDPLSEQIILAGDTLFDFMACEIAQDHEALGPSFKVETMRVWQARRLRTGVTECLA